MKSLLKPFPILRTHWELNLPGYTHNKYCLDAFKSVEPLGTAGNTYFVKSKAGRRRHID